MHYKTLQTLVSEVYSKTLPLPRDKLCIQFVNQKLGSKPNKIYTYCKLRF